MNRTNTWKSFWEPVTIPNCAALFFLILTLITANRYGFFGDELYYFACSKHLDWGYVDHPPMVALLTFLSTHIFGETMFSLRLMSGLTGATTVFLAALIAKDLGGGKFSQSLAALSICFAPAFPAMSSFFSMNPVDIMLCALFVVLFMRAIKAPSRTKWIGLGILLGAGLLNKYTFLVLGFSLLVSLVITKQWSILRSPWLYAGGALSFVIFVPHILWQMNHGWPTLEFMRNATEYKNLSLSPFAFLSQLAIGLNPFTLPLWLSGLAYLLFVRHAKAFRFLGWTAVVFLLVYMVQKSKVYYVVPIFPILLAAGAVLVERFSQAMQTRWIRWASVSLLIVSGTALMPLAVPVLPVNQFVVYAKTLGVWNMIRMEKGEGDVLPLHFVYRFGWEELVDTIGNAYKALPQDERDSCAVLASWYGLAGAIDHYGPKVGLPNAICPRNNYWLWGTRDYSGKVILAVGYDAGYLTQFFDSVEPVAHFDQSYAYGADVYLCRRPKVSLDQMWPRLKRFI
ncbi:MAG: glycosyltransferase family 39 protein [Bacteroidota bacterium]